MMISSTHPMITTRSGRQVSLHAPRPDQIDIGDIAHGLAYQCRFNGQVSRFYSVAQHSILVASILPDHLKLAGLLHDAAEAYLGDIVQPLKQFLPEFERIERRFMAVIGDRLGIKLDHHPEVKHADLVALATEKRDLLPREKSDWDVLEGIQPLSRLILPMTPVEAEDAFLKTFMALLAARSRKPLRQSAGWMPASLKLVA